MLYIRYVCMNPILDKFIFCSGYRVYYFYKYSMGICTILNITDASNMSGSNTNNQSANLCDLATVYQRLLFDMHERGYVCHYYCNSLAFDVRFVVSLPI